MVNKVSFTSLLGALYLLFSFHVSLVSAASVVVESSSPLFQYGPQPSNWIAVKDSAASGGSYQFSNVTNSVALIQYTFRSFTINAPKWPAPVKLQIRVGDTPYAISLQDTSVAPNPNKAPSTAGSATVPSGPIWTFQGGFQATRSIRIMSPNSWSPDPSAIPWNVVDSITFVTRPPTDIVHALTNSYTLQEFYVRAVQDPQFIAAKQRRILVSYPFYLPLVLYRVTNRGIIAMIPVLILVVISLKPISLFAVADTILVEDDNELITYADPFEWFSQIADGAASGGTYHFSNVEGNVASLTYTFRSMTYNTPRWSRPLTVQLRIDGKSFDVDLQDTSVAPDIDQPPMLGPASLTSAPVFTFDVRFQ
ncbi:hypothetical protein BJ165DRAFT_1410089 [Panaeolus papilionaceus]|nr:hypothetical protein BJ165DRAFT_1410089 [Panaeolus papilionaceus]